MLLREHVGGLTWLLMADGLSGALRQVSLCIVRVLDDLPPIRFPVLLGTHRELRASSRIRGV